MKISISLALFLIFFVNGFMMVQAQNEHRKMKPENYTVFNRKVLHEDGTVYLNAGTGDGMLWLNNTEFKNGTIELDIKGRNVPGKSFTGIAFHGKNNHIFDAVYFRPFNFKNPDRNKHSLQYISMPNHDWSALRQAYPGKYENTISPVPENEDEWFHAKIVVNYPHVTVYINGSKKPSLEVEQLSNATQGKIGFWVGNGSDGWFKNLVIKAENESEKCVLMDVSHGQVFYDNPERMEKDNQQLERVRYMTGEVLKNLSTLNAKLSYTNGSIGKEDLKTTDLLFVHIPTAQYTPEEVKAITSYVRNGGSLLIVMEEDYWTTLQKSNANDLLQPFDLSFGGQIPDSLSGGYTKAGILTEKALKISYHGGRQVHGGTPFCFPSQSEKYPFGVYKQLPGGGKIIALGDGMASLYMTSWNGIDGYECSEFMEEIFNWLLESD